MASKLQVGVVGLGKFGFRFGKTLIQLGHLVLGIDIDPENIKRAQHIFTQVFQADGMDKTALTQLGFADLNCVLVSVGDSIASSTMISMHLKELGIPAVWVKAVNADHEKLLRKIGADDVIIPEDIAARQLASRLAIPGFIQYLPFDENIALREITVDHWSGESLRKIDLTNKFGIQVIAIKKFADTKFKFIPKADDLLNKGDTLMVIGRTDQILKVKP